ARQLPAAAPATTTAAARKASTTATRATAAHRLRGDHGCAHARRYRGRGIGEPARAGRPRAPIPGRLVPRLSVGNSVTGKLGLEALGPGFLDAQRNGIGQDSLE